MHSLSASVSDKNEISSPNLRIIYFIKETNSETQISKPEAENNMMKKKLNIYGMTGKLRLG